MAIESTADDVAKLQCAQHSLGSWWRSAVSWDSVSCRTCQRRIESMNQSYAELNGRKLELVMGIGLQWRKTSHARQIYICRRYICA